MGSDCSCTTCSDPEAADKNTDHRKRTKGSLLTSMAPMEFEEVASDSEEGSVSAILDAPVNGITPNGAMMYQSTDDVGSAFKSAVYDGDEELAMHLDQQYPDLNLLDAHSSNGDSVLHIAVRNRKSKLIVYCLENGLSV